MKVKSRKKLYKLNKPDKICIHPQMWKTVVDFMKTMNIKQRIVRRDVMTAAPAKIVATYNKQKRFHLVSFQNRLKNFKLSTWNDIDGKSIISSSLPLHVSPNSVFSHILQRPIRPPVSDSRSPTHSLNREHKTRLEKCNFNNVL